MGYDIEGVGRSVEHLAHKVSSLTDAVTDNVKEDKESNMGDIAGLLALMQGNKGMDLPGLLALCKEKGYDRGWGWRRHVPVCLPYPLPLRWWRLEQPWPQ